MLLASACRRVKASSSSVALLLPRATMINVHRRTIKVKPTPQQPHDSTSSNSSSSASSSSSKSSSSKDSSSSSSEPRASEGMDLFSRAMAAQRARQEAAHAAASSKDPHLNHQQTETQQQHRPPPAGGDAADDEPLSPEDEERIRRLRERAEAQELKTAKGRGKIVLGALLAGVVGAYAWAGMPGTDDVEGGEKGFMGHHRRAVKALTGGYKEVTGPAKKSLLPDMLPEQYQKRNTLFIELSDTLVHMTWDKSLGWRAAMRPGVKEFLSYLTRYYEIVIFTNSHNYIAQPVIEALDPYGYTLYKLYRDSTRLVRGKNVKDLSMTNRDLARSVIVDWDPKAYQLQPENGVHIRRWSLEADDRELTKVMAFLEEIALYQEIVHVSDIRKIMKLARDQNASDPVAGWDEYKKLLRSNHDKLILDQTNKQRAHYNLQPFSTIEEAIASRRPPLSASPNSYLGYALGLLFGGRGSITNPTSATTASSSGGGGGEDGPGYGNIVDVIEYTARMERKSFAAQRDNMMKQVEADYKRHNEEVERQINEMKAKKLKLKDYIISGPPQLGAQQPSGGDGAVAPA